MKNKINAALTMFLLVSFLLAGCSQSADDSNAETSVESSDSVNTDNASESNDYVLKVGYSGGLCEAPLHMAVVFSFYALFCGTVVINYSLELVR